MLLSSRFTGADRLVVVKVVARIESSHIMFIYFEWAEACRWASAGQVIRGERAMRSDTSD